MISWGLVTVLTGFVRMPGQFYAVRFSLGVAEASFVPEMIVKNSRLHNHGSVLRPASSVLDCWLVFGSLWLSWGYLLDSDLRGAGNSGALKRRSILPTIRVEEISKTYKTRVLRTLSINR
jgi:hypothetical protein